MNSNNHLNTDIRTNTHILIYVYDHITIYDHILAYKISVADKHRPYLDGFGFGIFGQNPTNELQSAFVAVIRRPPETGGTEPPEHVFMEVFFALAL